LERYFTDELTEKMLLKKLISVCFFQSRIGKYPFAAMPPAQRMMKGPFVCQSHPLDFSKYHSFL